MKVMIEAVDGNQMAAKITGSFEIDGAAYPFSAIAFGRIGGQNIGAKLSRETVRSLKRAGHDPDDTIDELQRCMVRGEVILPEGLTRDSFADT